MSKSVRHQALSPDGIYIDIEHWDYPSKKAAEKALDKWMKRYEQQGYYSSNQGRIPLEALKEHCSIVPTQT